LHLYVYIFSCGNIPVIYILSDKRSPYYQFSHVVKLKREETDHTDKKRNLRMLPFTSR